jgi:hypothetical protein
MALLLLPDRLAEALSRSAQRGERLADPGSAHDGARADLGAVPAMARGPSGAC